MKRGKRVYDPVTDTWSTGYWILTTQKNIDQLKERNKILEERCTRYREIMLNNGINIEHVSRLISMGKLSLNDWRYLAGLDELDELDGCEEHGDLYTAKPKPPLGVMSKDLWNRQRQKDLADAMVRYLEAGMKTPLEWIEEYNEISDRLKEVKE